MCYLEEDISKQIEIPYLLTVLLAILLDKLPCYLCCLVWYIQYLMRNIIDILLRSFHFSYNIIMNFTHITLLPKKLQMWIPKTIFIHSVFYQTIWWVINDITNELIKVWNITYNLNKIKIFHFDSFVKWVCCLKTMHYAHFAWQKSVFNKNT